MNAREKMTRTEFITKATRWLLAGALSTIGIFQILKRRRLEREGGCVEYNTCVRCVEYKGCSKPEKV